MKRQMVMTDANEATAYVAYRLSEVIAIYPITPSSPMGEYADQWMAERVPNLWGTIPSVNEMQSEGGAKRSCARSIAGWRTYNHLHSLTGVVTDDPQHVQDCR